MIEALENIENNIRHPALPIFEFPIFISNHFSTDETPVYPSPTLVLTLPPFNMLFIIPMCIFMHLPCMSVS